MSCGRCGGFIGLCWRLLSRVGLGDLVGRVGLVGLAGIVLRILRTPSAPRDGVFLHFKPTHV